MKKAIIIFCAAALACACTKTIEPADPQGNRDGGTIHISMDATTDGDGAMSKVIMDADRYLLWAEGDEISLINKTGESYGEPLVLDSGAGTVEGRFTGEAYGSESGWYGVYPYDADNAMTSDGAIKVGWYGNNQQAVKGGIAPGHLLMAGESVLNAGSLSIGFRNLLAYFKFTTDFACSEITIESNGEKPLACQTLDVVFGEDGAPAITGWTYNHAGDGAVHLLNSSDDIEPGTYYLAVIPQTLSDGFSIVFKPSDEDKAYYRKASKPAELKRNTILNLGAFSKSSLSTDGEFSGAGTEGDPYLISSVAQLMMLSDLVFYEDDGHYASAYYKQTCSIDCDGKSLDPIGYHSTSISDKPFKGTYDGQNFTISNFIPSTTKATAGLFGGVKNATLKNIVLEPCSFKKTTTGIQNLYFGILAGFAMSEGDGKVLIDNCHVKSPDSGHSKATISIKADFVTFGAMVGGTNGNLTVTGCTNSMDLHTETAELVGSFEQISIGGMVGRSYSNLDTKSQLIFNRCRNTGEIWCNGNAQTYAGGIIGRVFEDASAGDAVLWITNCVNNGKVTAATNANDEDAAAGGIVGSNRSDGYDPDRPHLYNCLNTGDVTCVGDDGYGGGIIGFIYSGDTKMCLCVNTGQVLDRVKGMSEEVLKEYDPHLGAIGGDNGTIFTNPGTYCYCYWTNSSTMPIVFGESSYSKATNCSYCSTLLAADINSHFKDVALDSSFSLDLWNGRSDLGNLDILF